MARTINFSLVVAENCLKHVLCTLHVDYYYYFIIIISLFLGHMQDPLF